MKYMNHELGTLEKSLGVSGQLNLQYNQPLNVPQNFSAVAQTTQNTSSLSIQNQSAAFALTVYLDPAPTSGPNPITIAANDRTPAIIVQNYNGATLKVANISQEAATAKVTLTDLG